MATLFVPISRDYRPDNIGMTDVLEFTNGASTNATATLNESQFVVGNGLEDLTVVGSAGINIFTVYTQYGRVGDITFQNWDAQDSIFAYGSAQNDIMEGQIGSDRLYGGAGDDFLEGRQGADSLFGGSGNDTIRSWDDGQGDFIYGGSGTDTVEIYAQAGRAVSIDLTNGGGGLDIGTGQIIFSCEKLFFVGEAGNHTVTGGALDDFMVVREGNSTLNGAGGNDVFQLDFVLAGSSAQVNGGSGTDRINLYWLSVTTLGPLTLDLSDGGGGREIIAGTTLTSIEAALVVGTGLGDYLRGGSLADYLRGGEGNDTIIGGAGADTLGGDDGTDVLSYAFSTAGVSVNLTTLAASGGDAAGDVISGFENVVGGLGADTLVGNAVANVLSGGNGADSLRGEAGADVLIGGSGNDTLDGGSGNDTLTGGGGLDRLTGGLGSDTFVFLSIKDSTVANSDLITDFARKADTIDLSAIDAIQFGLNDAFTFIGTSAFTQGQAGQLRYAQTLSTTVVQGDVNGDGVADVQIVLQGLLSMTASDFLL